MIYTFSYRDNNDFFYNIIDYNIGGDRESPGSYYDIEDIDGIYSMYRTRNIYDISTSLLYAIDYSKLHDIEEQNALYSNSAINLYSFGELIDYSSNEIENLYDIDTINIYVAQNIVLYDINKLTVLYNILAKRE